MNHLTVQQLSAALDGALSGPSLELVVHHLAHCHECRDRQARLARNDDVLRRLLAQDPHDFFLDDLERRVEAVVVAIMRGLPVPPMVTSSPLQSDEDPLQPAEPPLPARPELGRAGAIAQEAGFGRIGLKPAGSTQPPASDPAEAQRLLEALERGSAGDFTELPSRGPNEPASVDGPVFDLPGWVKQGSAPKPGAASRPREVQKVQLFLEQLGDRTANPSHEAVEEMFRRESPAPPAPPAPLGGAPMPPPQRPAAAPAPSEPDLERFKPPALRANAPLVPAPAPRPVPPNANDESSSPAARSGPPPLPASRPMPVPAAPATPPVARQETPASPMPPPPPLSPSRADLHKVVVKETPWKPSASALMARPQLPPTLPPPHRAPVTEAYEQVLDRPRKPVPRVRPTPRFAGAWLLATASVGGLLVLVLALQYLPPADTPGASAWRGFRLPDIQFAPGDSTTDLDALDAGPEVRSATTPIPVDMPVPSIPFPPGGSLADSAGVPPDSLAAAPDTLGAASSR